MGRQRNRCADLGLPRHLGVITKLGFGSQLSPALNVTVDIDNLFNEPQARYRGISDQMQSTSLTGTTVTLGVSDRV